jgi:hypothetical protein
MLSVPITTDVLSSNLDQGEVKFVSDLRQVVWWFSPGPLDSSTIKTDRHNIAEILLKVALNKSNKQSRNIGFQSWLCRLVKM